MITVLLGGLLFLHAITTHTAENWRSGAGPSTVANPFTNRQRSQKKALSQYPKQQLNRAQKKKYSGGTEWSHDHVVNLMRNNRQKEALKYLEPFVYRRNPFLDACSAAAIIYTWGDNGAPQNIPEAVRLHSLCMNKSTIWSCKIKNARRLGRLALSYSGLVSDEDKRLITQYVASSNPTQFSKEYHTDTELLFNFGLEYKDDEIGQKALKVSADRAHKGASFWHAQTLYEQGKKQEAVPYCGAMASCSCNSVLGLAARWNLIAIAQEQEGNALPGSSLTQFERCVNLAYRLTRVGSAPVHDNTEKSECGRCEATLCFCAECYQDVERAKQDVAHALFDAFCSTKGEVADEQAELVFQLCSDRLPEWYAQVPTNEEEEKERIQKLEVLSLYDPEAMLSLALYYTPEEAAPHYQYIADNVFCSPQEKCIAHLGAAQSYGRIGSFDDMCVQLASLSAELSAEGKEGGLQSELASHAVRLICDLEGQASHDQKQKLYEIGSGLIPDNVELRYKIALNTKEEGAKIKKLEELQQHPPAALLLAQLHKNKQKPAEQCGNIENNSAHIQQEKNKARLEAMQKYRRSGQFDEMYTQLASLSKDLPDCAKKSSQKKCKCDRCVFAPQIVRFICDIGEKLNFNERLRVYAIANAFMPDDIELRYKIAMSNPSPKQVTRLLGNIVEAANNKAKKSKNDLVYLAKARRQYAAHLITGYAETEKSLKLLEDDTSTFGSFVAAYGHLVLAGKIAKNNRRSVHKDLGKGAVYAQELLKKGLSAENWGLDTAYFVHSNLLNLWNDLTSQETEAALHKMIATYNCELQKKGPNNFEAKKDISARLGDVYYCLGKNRITILQQKPLEYTAEKGREIVDDLSNAAKYGEVAAYGALGRFFASNAYCYDPIKKKMVVTNTPWYSQEKAEEYYEKAMSHLEKLPHVARDYCAYLFKNEKYGRALKLLDEACALPDVHYGSFMDRGKLLMFGSGGRQDFDEAYRDFEKYREMETDKKSDTFKEAQQWMTIASCNKRMLFMMSNAELLQLESKLKNGKYNKEMQAFVPFALGILTEHIARMPGDKKTEHMKDNYTLKEAYERYEEASRVPQVALLSLNKIAGVLTRADKKKAFEGVASAKEEGSVHSAFAEALYSLAVIEQEDGNEQEASKLLQESAERGYALAYLYNAALPLEERYQKVLALDPYNAIVNNTIGRNFYKRGNYEQAFTYYQRAAESHPYEPTPSKNYAELLASGRGCSRDLSKAGTFFGYAARGYEQEGSEQNAQICAFLEKVCSFVFKDTKSISLKECSEVEKLIDSISEVPPSQELAQESMLLLVEDLKNKISAVRAQQVKKPKDSSKKGKRKKK